MTDDDPDAHSDAWTRRQALKGGTYATAGLIGLSTLSRDVQGQQNDPRVRLGDSWVIDDDGNSLQIENTDTGARLEYDTGQGAWVLADPINVGNNIVDGGTTVYNADTDTVGDGSTSANHQSIDTDELSVNQIAAKITASISNQTVSTGTTTKVAFDTTAFEDSDVLTVDLSGNDITVDVAGTYFVTAVCRFNASANWSDGNRINGLLNVNGSAVEQVYFPHETNARQSVPINYVDELSANDTIDFRVHHDSGGDETIQGSSSVTNMAVWRVA